MRIEQFPSILNAHRATLGAFMMSLEQQEYAPDWESANKIRLSL
jgi:hypothetical protein